MQAQSTQSRRHSAATDSVSVSVSLQSLVILVPVSLPTFPSSSISILAVSCVHPSNLLQALNLAECSELLITPIFEASPSASVHCRRPSSVIRPPLSNIPPYRHIVIRLLPFATHPSTLTLSRIFPSTNRPILECSIHFSTHPS